MCEVLIGPAWELPWVPSLLTRLNILKEGLYLPGLGRGNTMDANGAEPGPFGEPRGGLRPALDVFRLYDDDNSA